MQINELQDLVLKWIITSEQKDLILSYQSNNELIKQESKQWWFQNSLFTIWGILIFLGVMSLIALNRDGIADSIKILLSISLTWIMYVIWYYLKYIKQQTMLGWSLLFISWLLVGATIFLIAQIYNMTVSNDILLLLWMLLILPLVYFLKQKEFYWLYMILLSSILVVFLTSHDFESTDRRNVIALYQLFGALIIIIWYLHDRTRSDLELNKLYKSFWIWVFTVSSFFFLGATQRWWDQLYSMPNYITWISAILIMLYILVWFLQKKNELLWWALALSLFTWIKFFTNRYMLHDIIMILYSILVIYIWYYYDNQTIRRQGNLYLYWFLIYLYIRHWYWYMNGFVFFFTWWLFLIVWWFFFKKINLFVKNLFNSITPVKWIENTL